MIEFRSAALPLLVAAILVPAAVGFAVGGPPLGLAVGFITVAAIALYAIRRPPIGPIETAAATDMRRHVLIVISDELDDPAAVDRIRREADLDEPAQYTEVLVLAPAKSRLLDRWATDVARGRAEAQRRLVVTVASLGKAGIAADAAVGDENLVQAVEDELRAFPATEVILVTGTAEDDPDGERAATELAERLLQPLTRLVLDERARMRP